MLDLMDTAQIQVSDQRGVSWTSILPSETDINTDLKVSILEKAQGTSDSFREYKEDIWITRLQTNKPTGLNVSTHEFGQIYRSLYDRLFFFVYLFF